MSSYGLKFKEKHSYNELGLIMRSVDRSLLPAVKRQQVDITFLDGKFDLAKEPVYDNRVISVVFVYHFKNPADMQNKKRQMAAWLSGFDKLVFDDEPDKYYEAKVFEAVPIEQSLKRMAVQVGFECKPFALNNQQVQADVITEQGQVTTVHIEGNVRTCGKITLKNMGETEINSFSIRRERLKNVL